MAQSGYRLLENESQKGGLVSFDDSLYCQEEHWEEGVGDDCLIQEQERFYNTCFNRIADNKIDNIGNPNRPTPRIVKDQDLFWEEHELATMLSKEESRLNHALLTDTSLAMARREAVEWMLKVHAHFSFSIHTAVLAVNYLDRFLSGFKFQTEKPWLTQLTAVACLSLAAKVEETYVPLLLDLQVVETKYLFEAKTIQRMEILVLSTLEWKMNLVTPCSFLDYMARRLGLKGHLCREFLRRSEVVLLASVSDSRFMCYLPSVVAAATTLHVMNSFEPCIGVEYQNRLLAILGIDKDRVDKCGQMILELEVGGNFLLPSNKRKSMSMPESPNGVIDVSFSSDSSNDLWAVASTSVSSSPELLAKKMRIDQEYHLA